MDALPSQLLQILDKPNVTTDEREKLFYKAVNIVESCASRLHGDVVKMEEFVQKLEKMEEEIYSKIPEEPKENSSPKHSSLFFIFLPLKKLKLILLKLLGIKVGHKKNEWLKRQRKQWKS
ncbi:hypothetical protein QVD17_28768 [Tagetes erecta]|uniref:Uncharacterized protein n=1 Tax=Tagetes erecta TaxID=13708 RepID=A0AAD8KAZ4_TARER|nr:hypothetical protein QVD17_28768 [Tagetes erecta]